MKIVPYAEEVTMYDYYALVHAHLRLLAIHVLEVDPANTYGPEEFFTMAELHKAHQKLGNTMHIDTFRRHAAPMLEETGAECTQTGGRPAMLYRKKVQ